MEGESYTRRKKEIWRESGIHTVRERFGSRKLQTKAERDLEGESFTYSQREIWK